MDLQGADAGPSASDEFVRSLPADVQERVQKLIALQTNYDELEDQYEAEIRALNAKYQKQYGA